MISFMIEGNTNLYLHMGVLIWCYKLCPKLLASHSYSHSVCVCIFTHAGSILGAEGKIGKHFACYTIMKEHVPKSDD